MFKHKNSILGAIITAIGLCSANFIFQWQFSDVPNYQIAFERSWFQVAAITVAWLTW